jgi:hypothetical protein
MGRRDDIVSRFPMKPAVMLLAASSIAALSPTSGRAAAQDASAPEEVAITVGAGGASLVREVRSAQLVAGENRLRVFDVSPQIRPETAMLRALTAADALDLLEQSAWFEVLDVPRVLERLAGRPVDLLRFHESGVEELRGRLLFPPRVPGPHGDVPLPLYLEQDDGRIRLLDGAEIEIDALPPGDWNRLRLDWRVACRRPDRYRFELLYVSSGLQWRADHRLRIAADGTTCDFSSVATVENRTGKAWSGVKLSVAEADAQISGEVIRVMSRPPDGQTWANQSQWIGALARTSLRDGHTVSANVNTLINQGVPISAILG